MHSPCYSTISKLFLVSPSPTVGNSGDMCHSPSTKNLISYLHHGIWDVLLGRVTDTIKITQNRGYWIPSRSKHQGCRELCEGTRVFWRQMLSLTPTIKCAHHLHTLAHDKSLCETLFLSFGFCLFDVFIHLLMHGWWSWVICTYIDKLKWPHLNSNHIPTSFHNKN